MFYLNLDKVVWRTLCAPFYCFYVFLCLVRSIFGNKFCHAIHEHQPVGLKLEDAGMDF